MSGPGNSTHDFRDLRGMVAPLGKISNWRIPPGTRSTALACAACLVHYHRGARVARLQASPIARRALRRSIVAFTTAGILQTRAGSRG